MTWETEVVTLASYNICSTRSAGALTSMDIQFTDFDLAVVGSQEARDPTSTGRVYMDRWWLGCPAGTPSGNYGCQLWINLTKPWGVLGDRAMLPNYRDIVTLISEPRLFVVKMSLPIFVVIFIVAHSLYKGQSTKEVEKYWRHVISVVLKLLCRHGKLFCSRTPTPIRSSIRSTSGTVWGTCTLRRIPRNHRLSRICMTRRQAFGTIMLLHHPMSSNAQPHPAP